MAATPSKPTRSTGGSRPGGASARNGRTASPAGKGGASAGGGRTGGRRRRGWLRTTLLGLAIGVLAVLLIGTIGGLVFYNRTSLPDPNKDFATNTTFIYYRDAKTEIGSLSVQNRQSIDYKTMPQNVKDAVVAAENRTFWTDKGISPKGIVRSAWTILRGGEVQGGSTITQQYIKVMYLSQDRTVTRKLKELALAVKMGRDTPKETILADYLNTIYFGRGAYGIQAAAKAYFNVDAAKLTLPQSVVLASVLNNPSMFDPEGGKTNRANLLDRYHYVLDGMLQAGTITQAQHDAAAKGLPAFPSVGIRSTYGGTKGYLIQMVVDELHADGLSDSDIQGGGLKIVTTFDARLEKAAIAAGQKYEKVAADNAGRSASSIHAAIASVQVGTGEVLATYAGNNDYVKNSRNWATTPRPAASTFKAWATIACLRNGMNLQTPLNGDTFRPRGDTTTIRNENGEQYGTVSLQTAVKYSINTAFVDAMTQISDGPAKTIKAAQDAGLTKGAGWAANDRIPLGIAEVSPLDNASGYATIANEGVENDHHVVRTVSDRTGKVTINNTTRKGTQKVEDDVARDTNKALEEVVNPGGTGETVADLGRPIAGKTGTDGVGDEIKSAWFVAYTKQISTAVMFVAGDDGNHDLDPYKRSYDSTFYGGTYPAKTWLAYMTEAMKGLPVEDLPSAANVNGGQYYTQQPADPTTAPTYAAPTSTATARSTWTSTGTTATATASATQPTTTQSTTATATHTATATATATHTTTHTATATGAPTQRTTSRATRTATGDTTQRSTRTTQGGSTSTP